MSIGRRIKRIITANRSASAEQKDPGASLDNAHRLQVDQLEQARRSVADLAVVRHRVDHLARQAAAEADQLDREAGDAVANGNDDGARRALRRGIDVRQRLGALTRQHADVDGQVQQLEGKLRRLESTLQDNSIRYQSLKAQQGAAQAELGMQGALDSAGGAAFRAEAAAREAEQEARRAGHRAAAHEELSWSDPNSRRMEEAFEELEANNAADQELEELKKRANP
ncbi:PspA/IM30 family protein [Arthrobacter sp. H5]|uniref:PspA/IM30 family protein n=1 Tax=Arthrobacter sp. H5 TaxID=1267973 RepID=UPI000485B614|nr:PspA/IM30 family protein [Arthrobacter sp. H5]